MERRGDGGSRPRRLPSSLTGCFITSFEDPAVVSITSAGGEAEGDFEEVGLVLWSWPLSLFIWEGAMAPVRSCNCPNVTTDVRCGITDMYVCIYKWRGRERSLYIYEKMKTSGLLRV